MSQEKDRFLQVIAYIEANLDAELSVQTLCQVTHLSKYHFHRQCSAYFGMSVMSLVRSLRLKRSAFQLAYRQDKKVVDIALANGYESHEAFSRMFKKIFGQSPSSFRNCPDWSLWNSKYDPILILRNHVMSQSTFHVDLVEFPETLVAVMEHRGSRNSLGVSIQKFIAWRKENRLPPKISKTFNLAYEDFSQFDLCCSVNEPVKANNVGIGTKTLPGGKCATVKHVGSDDALGTIVDYLYTQWLESNDYSVRDFPVIFERVSFFPEVPESEMITYVYLPIE
jgi:AraC family transcriptional regulator